MEYEMIQGAVIDELLSSDAGQKIRQIAENVSAVQQGLYSKVYMHLRPMKTVQSLIC